MTSGDAPNAGPVPRDVALLDRIVEVDREQARLEAELAASICEFVDLRRAEPVPATMLAALPTSPTARPTSPRLARGLGADDPRTMDQRRSDLAVDLLTGRGPNPESGSAGRPAVAVVVPVQSLMGVDDTPGELIDRSASIPAPLAQEIAARPGTLFYRLLTDERGNLLDVAQLGRFPSDLLGVAIDIRDGTCRWPTCATSASRCDHDHTNPHPHGETTAADLGCGRRLHHRAKTHAGFALQQPEAGVFVWATPTGHRYLVEPEPLPVGQWPRPTVVDDHTPVAELIHLVDVDATGPPLWENSVADAFGADGGTEFLPSWEAAALAAGPAP